MEGTFALAIKRGNTGTSVLHHAAQLSSTSTALDGCDVSVVVPTHNRGALLMRTLDSLVAQEAGSLRYEIIVVDNNSADDTRERVAAFARQWPLVRYFFEPRPGVSRARNTGIAAARAQIVAFIDDDVEASPTWLATIKRTLDLHPEIDCVGGLIEPRWADPPPAWLTHLHWGAVALQAEKGATPYVDADHATPCLMTANFASRRSALTEVGGFSPDYFRDEDRELQLRLWTAGKRGLYVGSIAVCTEVPRERLKKSYHRSFNVRVGASHARMRYRDRIDRCGRLTRDSPSVATLFGTPGFIFRSLFSHAASWAWSALSFDWNQAFFHETRVLYFGSYIWARRRQEGIRLWRAPLEIVRFASAVLLNRRRGATPHPSRWPTQA